MLRPIRSLGVVLGALLVVAASCTATVDTSSGTGTTSTIAGATGTTVGNYGSSVTTAPPTTTRHLSAAELTGLLPSAAEIGPGYEVVAPEAGSESGGDDTWDEATRKACPELYDLYANFSQVFTVAYRAQPTTASRLFADRFLRQVAVELIDGDSFIPTKDQLDKIVGATNSCDTIEVPDEVTGGTVSVTLHASPDSHYGDLGMVMKMDIDRSGGILRRTIESSGHVRTFQRGQITVSITTVDGYDPTTYRALPVDYDLAANLAERIDADIEKLQDH